MFPNYSKNESNHFHYLVFIYYKINTDFLSSIIFYQKLHYPFLGYICLQCIMNIKLFRRKTYKFGKVPNKNKYLSSGHWQKDTSLCSNPYKYFEWLENVTTNLIRE